MLVNAVALDFLDGLERAETGLLTWGFVDTFFTEEEIEERASEFLANIAARGVDSGYATPWSLIDVLTQEHLLWRVSGSERYRTRMAEGVRLLARLRQIFPDARGAAWRTAPALVADYRLQLRPRLFPRRELPPDEVVAILKRDVGLGALQEAIVRRLLGSGTVHPRRLTGFQLRATVRILGMLATGRPTATTVSAGTGSGKTLAFYLPAYLAIAPQLALGHWTKCLAIYPRNELLKDQFREALVSARRVAATLRIAGLRPIALGALYGDVPRNASHLLQAHGPLVAAWPRRFLADQPARECPFVRCPTCGAPMVWRETDIRQQIERLVCSAVTCEECLEAEEVRLTRDRLLSQPPDVLFTTTEMLNRRMSSGRYGQLLGVGLPADKRPALVLLDEIHTYEGVHGAHIAFLLRRWRRLSEARPHIVGLSATITDASRFLSDLTGIGPGDVSEISPYASELEALGTEYLLALRGDPASGTSLLSTTIQAAMLLRRILAPRPGSRLGSRLFTFTDNLDVINRLFHNLLDAEGWDSVGRPSPRRPGGSLANLRASTQPQARERLVAGQSWALAEDIGHALGAGARARVGRTSSQDAGVDPSAEIIVATSSLEVGFDDPEVGGILQHKAPHSAAAFIQRRGRAGRRPEIRPWTVVVLSDYGRDRAAYQAYDKLFAPELPPRHLPLNNRAVLKIQATYALLDFLARGLPQGSSSEPWQDLAQPAPPGAALWAQEARANQAAYIVQLQQLLERAASRDQLAGFLARTLAVDDDTVQAILWAPPRALITEVVPTLLRRLERQWRRASGPQPEHHAGWPVPEFMPAALFSELNLPEVTIRLPPFGATPARVESMPLAQALQEFAPGRVSRRFAVSHGAIRHWIDPGPNHTVHIDRICQPVDRQTLGAFAHHAGVGITYSPVFRPASFDVSQPPRDVLPTSHASLEWHTQLVPSGDGHVVDLPATSPWRTILRALRFHTHHLGSPVEVRRFATAVEVSVRRRGTPAVEHRVEFICHDAAGNEQPAGLGSVADVDAIQVHFRYPERLYAQYSSQPKFLRALRPLRFRDLLHDDSRLDGLANQFQRDWLAHVHLATITVEALSTGCSLSAAATALANGTARLRTERVLQALFERPQALEDDVGPDDNNGEREEEEQPRRLRELADLLLRPEVRDSLKDAGNALWAPINEVWEPWLRQRFACTLAAALVEAAHDLCPRMEANALLVDLNPVCLESPPPTDASEGTIWLTEATIGGGGFVEELLTRYAEDPRRYLRLLEAVLQPSDAEWVADTLQHLLELATAEASPPQLREAFSAVRLASSHAASMTAARNIRDALSSNSIPPAPTLLVSVNARLLAPGTTPATDVFLATILREWDAAEERLSVDIDSRVFALARSWDARLEQALGVTPPTTGMEEHAAWRHAVLSALLWPRGAQLRAQALRAHNPFAQLPHCDRLFVVSHLPGRPPRVTLGQGLWFEQLTEILLVHGEAELVTSVIPSLADALLRLGQEPIDSGVLLLHARLAGVRREDENLIATIELPEAFQ